MPSHKRKPVNKCCFAVRSFFEGCNEKILVLICIFFLSLAVLVPSCYFYGRDLATCKKCTVGRESHLHRNDSYVHPNCTGKEYYKNTGEHYIHGTGVYLGLTLFFVAFSLLMLGCCCYACISYGIEGVKQTRAKLELPLYVFSNTNDKTELVVSEETNLLNLLLESRQTFVLTEENTHINKLNTHIETALGYNHQANTIENGTISVVHAMMVFNSFIKQKYSEEQNRKELFDPGDSEPKPKQQIPRELRNYESASMRVADYLSFISKNSKKKKIEKRLGEHERFFCYVTELKNVFKIIHKGFELRYGPVGKAVYLYENLRMAELDTATPLTGEYRCLIIVRVALGRAISGKSAAPFEKRKAFGQDCYDEIDVVITDPNPNSGAFNPISRSWDGRRILVLNQRRCMPQFIIVYKKE